MAGFSFGDIFLTLGIKTDGLESGLNDAKAKADGFLSKIGDGIGIAIGDRIVAGATAAVETIASIGGAVLGASNDFAAANAKIQGELQLTKEAAADYGGIVKSIFANNFGEDIDDVTESLIKVNQQFQRLGDLEEDDVYKKATEKSIALRDAYEYDVNQTASAAASLVENFGLNITEAYDFIAFGIQQGLDANGDFLDSIGEYSPQFKAAGADAGFMFNVFQSGMAGAVLGTDKAADALKEFRVRIQDGSKLTADGLAAMGLNVDKIQQGLADGSVTAAQAFQLALDGLAGIEDKTLQFQTGVALFGTQFEDLGTDAFLALRTTGYGIELMTGAMDKLNAQYNTLPQFFEGLRRQSLVALTPITDSLLEAANKAVPTLQAGFELVKPVIESFADSARQKIEGLLASITTLAENSTFVWQPDFKQITIPDIFHFVQDGAGTSINIADFFYLDITEKWTKIGLGDLFSFGFGETTDTLNIADYFTFEVDKAGFIQKLTLGDFFTFIKGEGSEPTIINLGKYVQFVYQASTGSFNLNIPQILGLSKSGEGDNELFKFNLANFVKFTYEPQTGETVFNIGEFLGFTKDEGGVEVFNIAEYVKVVWKPDQGITRLKIGNFIDLDSKDILAIEAAFTTIGEAITNFTEGIPERVNRVKESISQFIEIMAGAGERVTTGNTNFQLFIETLFSIQKGAENVGNAIENWATKVQESLKSIPGYEAFASYIQGLTGAAEATREAKAAADDLATEKENPVVTYFKGIGTTIKAAFTDLPGQIEGWEQALDGAGERVQSSLDTFEASVNAYGSRVAEAWGSYIEAFDTYKTNVSDQIAAVEKEIDAFGSKIKDFLSGAGEKVGAAYNFVIESPIWEKFITPLKWPAAIADFLWRQWLTVLTWPTKIAEFDWDTWLDILTWPLEIFSFGTWSDWVTGIDFTKWVPEFPTWAEVFRMLGLDNLAPAVQAKQSTAPDSGIPAGSNSGVDPNSPLGQASQGAADRDTEQPEQKMRDIPGVTVGEVNVYNNVDSNELIYQLGQRFQYGTP